MYLHRRCRRCPKQVGCRVEGHQPARREVFADGRSGFDSAIRIGLKRTDTVMESNSSIHEIHASVAYWQEPIYASDSVDTQAKTSRKHGKNEVSHPGLIVEPARAKTR